MLLSEYRDAMYWPWATTHLERSTLQSYADVWDRLVEPVWGNWQMDAIEPWGIDGWLGTLSPGNRPKARTCLSCVLSRAVHDSMLERNPVVSVPSRNARLKTPKTLDMRQVKQLLRGFWGHELEAWLLVSAGCGLRREEACALEWGDIDLRNGAVNVYKTLQWVGGELLFGDTKTPKSTRTVCLPPSHRRRLRQIRRHGFLTSGTDEPLSPDAVRKRYERFCKSHDLPYVPPRNLRHSWATNALEAGADPMAVAAMLGHADMNTMYRYYLVPRFKIFQDTQRTYDRRLEAA